MSPLAGLVAAEVGAVERLAAPARGRVVALAQLPHLFAVGAELLNGVDAVVGGQQRVVVADVEAVGAVVAEQALAEERM